MLRTVFSSNVIFLRNVLAAELSASSWASGQQRCASLLGNSKHLSWPLEGFTPETKCWEGAAGLVWWTGDLVPQWLHMSVWVCTHSIQGNSFSFSVCHGAQDGYQMERVSCFYALTHHPQFPLFTHLFHSQNQVQRLGNLQVTAPQLDSQMMTLSTGKLLAPNSPSAAASHETFFWNRSSWKQWPSCCPMLVLS